MSSTVHDAVTFPPSRETTAEVLDFNAALEARGLQAPHGRARLVSPDGTEIDLPEELFEILKFAAERLAGNQGVTVVPVDQQLTTQEAADFLGISRPTLVKIVDAGDLACTMVGRHRRVTLSDLLAYRENLARTRAEALQQMADIAREENRHEATATAGDGIR